MTAPEPAIQALMAAIGGYLASLGGSGIAEVRAGLARWGQGPPQMVTPGELPACQHLDAALAAVGEPLAQAIAAARSCLCWTSYDAYGRAEIGSAFADGHAFASLIGEGGFRAVPDFDLGLFVIAPGVFYRDHHHAAPELYAPLTGPHGWRFAPCEKLDWRPAHEPVWNTPWRPHATMTGPVPFLAIYCWTRDVALPAKVIASPDWTELEA